MQSRRPMANTIPVLSLIQFTTQRPGRETNLVETQTEETRPYSYHPRIPPEEKLLQQTTNLDKKTIIKHRQTTEQMNRRTDNSKLQLQLQQYISILLNYNCCLSVRPFVRC